MTEAGGRPVGLPDYAALSADDIRRAVDGGLRIADGHLERARSMEPGPALLSAVSDASRAVFVAYGRSAVLAAVHPDLTVREAAGEAGAQIAAWRAGLLRDAPILRQLQRVQPDRLDPEAATVLARWIAAMRAAGAELDAASRAELDALEARVDALQAAFLANQGADRTPVEVERDRLRGLPAAVLDGLSPGERPGTLAVPIELRQTVLERVADRGVREAVQRRWFEIAQMTNRPVLEELVLIHGRMAEILGHGSWSEARASGGTIGGPAAIVRFLDGLEPAFVAARDEQLQSIRGPLAADLGLEETSLELEDWDVPRGLALLRDQLGADGAMFREAFPLEAVLAGMAPLLERVFGIRCVDRSDEAGGWHRDVRRYDLTEAATGRELGTILLDPFAREGKLTGIAGMCDFLTLGGLAPDGLLEPTHTAIILFLAPPAAGEQALLAPSDIEALFHELGHALDFMLGNARFAPLDTDGWIRDWTEAPSQAIGRWAALPEVLVELGRDPATGEPLDLERVRAFARATETGLALHNLRFLWFARVDGLLHGPAAPDLDALWRAAWPIRGTRRAIDGFSPSPLMIIALGYDGVMYGFLWAQALLEEILDRFRRAGPLSPEVGAAYRRLILEPGWAPDPMDRMRRFIGREPTIEPYVAQLRGPDAPEGRRT
jgi:peptidyl-dipeptidase Dcp